MTRAIETHRPPWPLLGITSVLLAVPFFFATFTPATDLPQHLGQVYLLGEALRGNAPELAINWIAPGNLAYLLLGLCAWLFPPLLSAKIAMVALVVMWNAGMFMIAWHRRRPVEAAILLAPLAYGLALYWGFVQFMIGWLFFAMWLIHTTKPVNVRNGIVSVVLLALLYASHALWFLIGVLWLAVHALVDWRGWRAFIVRLSVVIPVGVLAFVWYPTLAEARKIAGFNVAPQWSTFPWTRLAPAHVIDSMFGGVKGALEPVMGIAIVLWIILALYTNRGRMKWRLDGLLLVCALMLMAIVFFAPDRYMNTIMFARRWFPCALILLVLAMPAPPGKRHFAQIAAVGIVLLFAVRTAGVWREFNKTELSGLQASLEALPRNQRVLGLSFPKRSDVIKGYPLLQTFAYAQACRGGRLNFSFAEHSSGIVRYEPPLAPEWTPNLEWEPERVTVDDFAWFDYALVNGEDTIHAQFARSDLIKPVTGEGRWRLYQVIH